MKHTVVAIITMALLWGVAAHGASLDKAKALGPNRCHPIEQTSLKESAADSPPPVPRLGGAGCLRYAEMRFAPPLRDLMP